MDMLKAFITISRKKVIENLKEILAPEKLHLMVEEVQLEVKVTHKLGKPFKTNIGTPQGDAWVLFTLYSAQVLKGNSCSTTELADHIYSKTKGYGHRSAVPQAPVYSQISSTTSYGILTDVQYHRLRCTHRSAVPKATVTDLQYQRLRYTHRSAVPQATCVLTDLQYQRLRSQICSIKGYGILTDVQYADNICWVAVNCPHRIERQKSMIPSALAGWNLQINKSKT